MFPVVVIVRRNESLIVIARGDAEPLLAVVWKNRHGRFMVLGILIDGVRLTQLYRFCCSSLQEERFYGLQGCF